MKKFVHLTSIVTGLEVLDDGPMFFGTARHQEVVLFVNINKENKRRQK